MLRTLRGKVVQKKPESRTGSWNALSYGVALVSLALGLCGCSIMPMLQPANDRAFSFERDTLSFDNETEWRYQHGSPAGYSVASDKDGESEYTLHCFVMSRSARQFFQFAHFDVSKRRVDDDTYRQLIKQVIAHDPSETEPLPERIVIPGYSGLRSFSVAKEALLKDELGSAAQSFLQRGNWRMIFPFSHDHQEETANSMLAEIRKHRPPVVHMATFPKITINHAVLLYAASETDSNIRFQVYDPNNAAKPTTLSFDRAKRSFTFPPNIYFAGGEVDVYEVYRSVVY
ncbi:MAG: hypothetical protein JWR07_1056 [Nevskia sp.]|nr:hypothetical protein [Nevskia sp.]